MWILPTKLAHIWVFWQTMHSDSYSRAKYPKDHSESNQLGCSKLRRVRVNSDRSEKLGHVCNSHATKGGSHLGILAWREPKKCLWLQESLHFFGSFRQECPDVQFAQICLISLGHVWVLSTLIGCLQGLKFGLASWEHARIFGLLPGNISLKIINIRLLHQICIVFLWKEPYLSG